GRFPTCTIALPPGTQEFPPQCPSLSPPPGPTGYVMHVQPAGAPDAIWLGCNAAGPPPFYLDSESDGKIGVSGHPSICSHGTSLDCLESVSSGFSLRQD